MIANRPRGVGVEGAPIATLIRRRRIPSRQTVTFRAERLSSSENGMCVSETWARLTKPRTRFPSRSEITPSQSPDSPTTASFVADPNVEREPTCATIRAEPGEA